MSILIPWIVSAQSVDDCLACHSENTLIMEKKGKTITLFVDHAVLKKSPHAKLVCVACHSGFDAGNVPHKEKIVPVNCLNCHKDAATRHLIHSPILKSKTSASELVVSCKQCHGTHDVIATKSAGSKFYGAGLTETCGKCHVQEKEHYLTSTHGKAAASGITSVPNCISCHLNRITELKGSKDSSSIKIAQEKMCLACHLDNSDVRARVAPSAKFIAAYEHSVHGFALLEGNGAAANCVDCHGSHAIQRERETTSTVNRANIPATCAKCHSTIEKEYSESIHGKSALNGNREAPVCTNCHGEHNILAPSDPTSPTAPRNVSQQVCSPCHNSVTLNDKYGIAGNRFQTFDASYHGLAIRSGSIQVANCASCHGVHNIKPSSDSTSSISKSNLAVTCGKCHPGANNRFTIGSVHVATEKKEDPLFYWISYIYILLISTIIGGMVLHNLLDFYRKSRRKLMIRRGLETEEHFGHTLYMRMTFSERVQHVSLLISFFTLVVTGFMLRYPDAFWVVSIRNLNTGIFDLRGLLHRVAAVVLIIASMYHLYYIFFTERGKQMIKDLLPRWNDVQDALAVLKYNFGFSKTKPRFGRFSYIEKSEYWALIWGNVVMVTTGLILWFDNTFMGLLTKLGWDVSRTIHFYEAWLAFLAILVWHIYFVIFNPNIYPMNLAWLKGTITEAEMADEHPLELEALKRKKSEEDDAMIIVDSEENSNGNGTKKQ
ncbi:MAG: cytochrome b/b6 domain-containing protein [Bacteroidota bacterium]